jgi:hypothetical protein
MFRKRLVSVAAAFMAALLIIASVARYAEAQKPGSSVMELCAPISASANVTGVAPVPLGTQLRVGARLVGVLKVTSASGAGTLDVYFQHSADDGQTWCDFAHVQQTAGSASTYYIPVSTIAGGSTTVSAINDGAMSANTAVQGPLGDRLRIKYSVGSIGTGPWNFQAFVLPD